jgi:hypothetical protein
MVGFPIFSVPPFDPCPGDADDKYLSARSSAAHRFKYICCGHFNRCGSFVAKRLVEKKEIKMEEPVKRSTIAIVLSVLLLAALCRVSDSHGQDNFARVAKIFGRDIYISDLNPTDDEFKMIKRVEEKMKVSPPSTFQPPQRSDDQIVSEVRSEKLAGLIWEPIWEKFDKAHGVKPTEAELDDHIRAMEALTATLPDRHLPDDPRISPKMKKEIEREVAEHIVTQWKRNKALYEEYGGIVLFQQLNPMEAFGAMRKLLESHEAKGDFQIYDEQLKQQFWKYYLREPVSWKVMKPENIDYSEPWWLKKPPDAGK